LRGNSIGFILEKQLARMNLFSCGWNSICNHISLPGYSHFALESDAKGIIGITVSGLPRGQGFRASRS
jgi:hypothetical protein